MGRVPVRRFIGRLMVVRWSEQECLTCESPGEGGRGWPVWFVHGNPGTLGLSHEFSWFHQVNYLICEVRCNGSAGRGRGARFWWLGLAIPARP
jgi:hypothetical protein